MPPRVDTKLVAERDTDLIVKRPNLDTRTPGKSVIAKALPSDHIEVRGSGADAGTGDVSFWLKKTGVKPGLYNQFKTDAYGRIIEASYVENAGSGSSTDTIWNQSTAAQDANFWIDGNGRVDGSLVAGSLTTGSLSVSGAVTFSSLTLGTPLSTSSGGTGAATVAAELFFAGPVSGVNASPSWRAIAASDLPPIPFSFITGLPNTLALHGITNGVTLDTVQSISGVKTFGAAPLMSAGLEFASGAPASTANKLYQVSSTLYWNGVAVGSTYSLPVASSSTLGGVKVGAGISVAGDGTLSVAALTRRQLFTVGNGTDTAFNLAHNFSTTGVSVSIRKATGTRSQVVFDNYLTPGNETNAVTVTFPTAPATGEYEVTIIADNAVLESSHPLSGLSDVSFSGLVAGQALMYNGSSWSNASVMTTNDAILNANVHTEIQWNARQNASMRINGIVQGGAFAVCDPSASSDVEYTWQHQNGWFYAALETNNDFALGPYQDVSGSAQRHPAMRVKVSGFQPYRIDFLAPLTIVDGTPSVTTNALYSVGGALYWNGSVVGAPSNYVTTDTTQTITGAKAFTSSTLSTAVGAYGKALIQDSAVYLDRTIDRTPGDLTYAAFLNGHHASIGACLELVDVTSGVYRVVQQNYEYISQDSWWNFGTNVVNTQPTRKLSVYANYDFKGGVWLSPGTPPSTANALYNVGGALYWNGVQVTTGASISGNGTAGRVMLWSSSNAATSNPGLTTATYSGVVSELTLGDGTTSLLSPYYVVDAPSNGTGGFAFRSAGGNRWVVSRSDTLYEFHVRAFDGNSEIDRPLVIANAAAGPMTFGGSTARPASFSGALTVAGIATVNNRSVFTTTMSVHGSVNTILVTANHDQSSGAAWALTAATRFKSGAGASSDAKGHTSFTTFQDSVNVASSGLNKARGFYAVAAQNDSSNSSCGVYYGYSTLTGSGGGTTSFAEYASFAVDDENYVNAAFTNRYGLLVKTGNVTPSAGWFGVYIQDGPASPSRYSIYTGNAPSRFGGSVELPSFTPSTTTNRLYNVSGTLYWNGSAVGSSYTLPTASDTVLGGIKVGAGLSINAGVLSVGPSVSLDYIDFNTSLTQPSYVTGRIYWNNVDNTLDAMLTGGSILQVGQETLVRAVNNTGATIANGSIVYISGAQGNRPTIALANASVDAKSKVVGVATQDVANNTIGYFTVHGTVHDIDTSSFAEGAEVWLGTVDGSFVAARPTAPNAAVCIGYIVRSHATVGQLFVSVNRGFKLADLGNVSTSSLADGQVLTYNGGVWSNATPTAPKIGVASVTPAANTSMTSAWISRHTRVAPSASINVVVEPGIASAGDEISLLQENTTFFTLTAGSGVTLRCATSQVSIQPRAMYSNLRLICVAANTYDVVGDFVP